MHPIPSPIVQPNGDVLVPAATAQFIAAALQRLKSVLEHEQGLQLAESGATESTQQTANRQDYVDQLSASVGIKASKVPDSRLPVTSRAIDHADLIAQVQRMSELLSGKS